MYALRYLDARVDQEDELSEKLQEVMAGMEDTMKEFGTQ
jgi:SOS response regulatory protein OraA/RecX